MEIKIMRVGGVKTGDFGRKKPRIEFTGRWLNQIGFDYGSFVTFSYINRMITFKLLAPAEETGSNVLMVSRALKTGEERPRFEVKGFWLDNLGFKAGCFIVVQFEYGLIRIRVLDIENSMQQ